MEFDQFFQWCGDEIDHGDEGKGVAVAMRSCPGGLEDAIEAFQPCIGIGRGPSPQDERGMSLQGGQGL